jgi:DNA invertase Pin-like site-specific DNA recombinase
MSTDHQEYSTANQEAGLRAYADTFRRWIGWTYLDEGKSGLRLEGRKGLKQLLADVERGEAPFKTILVYDISRWGRFQDSDEAAHYEFVCRQAGITVEYCAEQFRNDGTMPSTLMKNLKRFMAGEYSRELSEKVYQGQCRLIGLGFRQGGPAGYGLRRMLVDEAGKPKSLLRRGEHKSIQTDRVILVHGPEDEVAVVRRIYDLFTRQGMKERDIADVLNGEGVINTEVNRPWTAAMVREVLTNEKYVGHNVFNRKSFKLKLRRVRNAPEEWVRRDNAFKAVIKPEVFFVARGIFLERSRKYSDEELIAGLKSLLAKYGTLTATLIDAAEDLPSSGVYQHRFGSLITAYGLAGFRPEHDFSYIEINRYLRGLKDPLVEEITTRLSEIGATVTHREDQGILLINGQYTVDFIMTRCRQTPAGALRWITDIGRRPADVSVVVRMDAANRSPVDFFLLPRIAAIESKLRLAETNRTDIDGFQFENLNFLVTMADRVDAEEAA